jgi:hypothetical protein
MKKTNKKKSVKAKKMSCENKMGCSGACGGAIYGLGFIGALVYYISTATGFWNGAFGVIKALLWPAFVVFELMKSLGM